MSGWESKKQMRGAGRTKISYHFFESPFTYWWLNILLSHPHQPNWWATKVTYPDVGFVLSWSCPTIRHACVLCWVYVLAIVCALLCMLQVVGVCFWHWAALGMSVLCSVRLTRVPVLVRATNDWVWALCSLSSAEASAKFTRFWVLLG